MAEEIVSTETIINYLEDSVKQKIPIAPTVFLDAAIKLNLLLSDEQAFLFELQQRIAKEKLVAIEAGKSVAEAKVISEASDDYKKMQIQKGKIERIIEFIRLAKHHSKISLSEMQGY